MRRASGQMLLALVHCCWPDVVQWPVKFKVSVDPVTAAPMMLEEATKTVEIVKFMIPVEELAVHVPALKAAELRSAADSHAGCCYT
eukprot:2399336-Lingulodinium_polyedra.AAC.1